MRIDPTKTWRKVEERLQRERNPRLRGEETYTAGDGFAGIAARKITAADLGLA